MYYMLECYSPLDVEGALVDYAPDKPPGELFRRNWKKGQRFASPPALPVVATVPSYQAGQILEMHTSTLPLMSKRLADALRGIGVSNVDFYAAEIRDEATGAIHDSHVAFNIVGNVAAADLGGSTFVAPDGPMISTHFNSLKINESAASGLLIFRLAESLMGIVVHARVKAAIESAGIDTLSFVPPNEWVS
jgi:hypothetical protein